MNFKCYNTDDDKLESDFSISPSGIIISCQGIEKPHWKLLRGTGVMDEGREIFEHDLYIDEYDDLHEVVFKEGGFWLEVDHLCADELLSMHEIRQSGLQYVGNAYINPEIYEKQKR